MSHIGVIFYYKLPYLLALLYDVTIEKLTNVLSVTISFSDGVAACAPTKRSTRLV